MKKSTIENYHHHLYSLQNFTNSVLDTPLLLPVSPYVIALWIAELFRQDKKPCTIISYLSGISFFHKLYQIQDNTHAYLVTKMIQGVKNLTPNKPQLQPINISLLEHLTDILPYILHDNYSIHLYKAIFCLMYFACLRVGEVAHSSHADNTLQITQVSFTHKNSSAISLSITFNSYKHSKNQMPTLSITTQNNTKICPVLNTMKYLSLRTNNTGPLFQHKLHVPVSRTDIAQTLSRALYRLGLGQALINTHSFRIGRATDLWKSGHSDSYIQKVGRWASDAYKHYLRPHTVCI